MSQILNKSIISIKGFRHKSLPRSLFNNINKNQLISLKCTVYNRSMFGFEPFENLRNKKLAMSSFENEQKKFDSSKENPMPKIIIEKQDLYDLTLLAMTSEHIDIVLDSFKK